MTLREAAGHAKEMFDQHNEEDYWIDIEGWVFNVFAGDLIGEDPDTIYVTAYEESPDPLKAYGEELETFHFRASIDATAVLSVTIPVRLWVDSGKTVAEAKAELEALLEQSRLDWIVDHLSIGRPDVVLVSTDHMD
jgi:hypothetical protein